MGRQLKIIPVLDILGQVGVHAVRGERRNYKPLKSVLCESSDPLDIAFAFKKLGFKQLYVADIDAISTNKSNTALISQIAKYTGLKLMVDAGVSNFERAEQLLNYVAEVIIGTETLSSPSFVGEAVRRFGRDRIILSLDMKDGKLLGNSKFEKLLEPIGLLKTFQEMDVEQVIVLDLARVGSGEGVDKPFLEKIVKMLDLEIFVGGGVQGIDDLLELNDLGVTGVLLATALHSGKITVDELKHFNLSLE